MTEQDIIKKVQELQYMLRMFPRRGEETELLVAVSAYLYRVKKDKRS